MPARPSLPAAARQPPEAFRAFVVFLPLPVQPDVFHTPAIEMAVHHLGEPLDPRLPAGRTTGIEQDRPGDVRRQPALDLPENRLAPLRVALARLLFDQLLYLGVAVAVPVDARPAAVEDL